MSFLTRSLARLLAQLARYLTYSNLGIYLETQRAKAHDEGKRKWTTHQTQE